MDFDRWTPVRDHSWPYYIFKQYNEELMRMRMAHKSASQFTYHVLAEKGAKFDDKASKFLFTNGNNEITLRNWSDSYNMFDNWILLNQMMALSSYFETYLAAIVKLAIASDPGLLLDSSHSIDGMKLIKYNRKIKNPSFEKVIEECTKGDWMVRTNNLRRLFNVLPISFETSISDLEVMRNIRNDVGHAFGRDIKSAQRYDYMKITPMKKLKTKTFMRIQTLIGKIVKDLDCQLMANHIGCYLPLHLFHNLYPSVKNKTIDEKIRNLKKAIGYEGDNPYSKDFCGWVVRYYENL